MKFLSSLIYLRRGSVVSFVLGFVFIISLSLLLIDKTFPVMAQFGGPADCEGATVAGTIYVDTNRNGVRDGSEPTYTTKQDISTFFDVQLTPGGGFYSRLASSYRFQCTPSGTHTIRFTRVPEGYVSTGSPQIFLNPGQFLVKDLGIALEGIDTTNVGTISGCVFIDSDENGVKNGSEQNYTQGVDVRLSPTGGTLHQSSPGCYQYDNVPVGNYTLRLYTIANGYFPTFPPTASSYNVNLRTDTSCTIVPDNGPQSCVTGKIVQANFGITQSRPWIQAATLNIRNENGITNPIPSTSSCSTVMIRDGSNGTPGILFSGSGSSSFGEGSVSGKKWIVSGPGTAYGRLNQLKTSYNTVLETVKANEKTFIPLSDYCNLNNCTITNSIANEPYRVTGSDLTLRNVTITSKKVILLVDGTVHISGPIQVSPGAFFMIASKGDIIVDPAVGASTPSCSSTSQLQGIFSTDRNFIVLGGAVCPTVDKQLKVSGSIITNASLTSRGKFSNNRTLCSQNAEFPVFMIEPRLDFILNVPESFLKVSTTWQEVAP